MECLEIEIERHMVDAIASALDGTYVHGLLQRLPASESVPATAVVVSVKPRISRTDGSTSVDVPFEIGISVQISQDGTGEEFQRVFSGISNLMQGWSLEPYLLSVDAVMDAHCLSFNGGDIAWEDEDSSYTAHITGSIVCEIS